jgi:hypothetical protein
MWSYCPAPFPRPAFTYWIATGLLHLWASLPGHIVSSLALGSSVSYIFLLGLTHASVPPFPLGPSCSSRCALFFILSPFFSWCRLLSQPLISITFHQKTSGPCSIVAYHWSPWPYDARADVNSYTFHNWPPQGFFIFDFSSHYFPYFELAPIFYFGPMQIHIYYNGHLSSGSSFRSLGRSMRGSFLFVFSWVWGWP